MKRLKGKVDATEDLQITVTEMICRLSTPGDPKHCALSVVIQLALGRSVKSVRTLRTICEIELRDEIRRHRVYGSLARAITAYDSTGIFPPGTYTLHRMNPAWTLPAVKAKNEAWGDRRPYEERVRLAEKFGVAPPPSPSYSKGRRVGAGRRHKAIYVHPRGSPGYVPPSARAAK